MEKLLLVYVEEGFEHVLCDVMAKISGVETVFALDGRDPDYVIIAKPLMGEKVADDLRCLMGVRLINVRSVGSRQEHSRHITDVSDIPGPLPSRPKMKAAAGPITRSVPGVPPSSTAVVHHNFSSQAGLASLANRA